MEQQLDAFTQKRFELMVEMATKKLQQEIDSLKVAFNSLNGELNSMKSQVSRMQFQPQEQPHHASRPAAEEQPAYEEQSVSAKKDVKIVDCRPDGERKNEFVSGSAKNSAEPIRPRFG